MDRKLLFKNIMKNQVNEERNNKEAMKHTLSTSPPFLNTMQVAQPLPSH